MAGSDIATIIGSIGAPLLLIGGGVKWIVGRVDKLDERLKREEKRSARLEREYGRVVLQVQRWRTAFQIVAAELERLNPGNPMLGVAQRMMAERVPDAKALDEDEDQDTDLVLKLDQEPLCP